MDMCFYWIQDRVAQGHFIIYWRPGALNMADYYTKHFSAAHHQLMRSTYLHVANHLSVLAYHYVANLYNRDLSPARVC